MVEGHAVVLAKDGRLISLFHCHPPDDKLFAIEQHTFTESRVRNERLNHGCDASCSSAPIPEVPL